MWRSRDALRGPSSGSPGGAVSPHSIGYLEGIRVAALWVVMPHTGVRRHPAVTQPATCSVTDLWSVTDSVST